MTLRHLQVFVEVCNQGTMSAAAKKLYITQSAISQIIKDLEGHYGVILFRRVSHKLYLTEAGNKLYSHAIKMVQYNELIESTMADTRTTSTLRIGSISAFIMIDLVAEYKKRHPELSVSMIHQTRSVLDMLLYSSQLDVAIVSGLFNLSNYDFYPLTTFDIIFACNKNTALSPLLQGDLPEISVEELSRFPLFICKANEDVEPMLNSVFLEYNIHYNVVGTFINYSGLTRVAIEDLGIVLINYTNFEMSKKYLKQVKVRGTSISSRVSLVCSKSNSENPEIRSFIEFATSNFSSIKKEYGSKEDTDLKLLR